MAFLLDLANVPIKFYEGIVGLYDTMKKQAFKNHWLYYATYDTNTKQYSVLYNYNNPLSVLYFYVFRYLLGYYHGCGIIISPIDTNIISVVHYVKDTCERYLLYKQYMLETPTPNILYAYTDCGEDLTHEFQKFRTSIFQLGLDAQDLYNIIVGYKGRPNCNDMVEYIKYMTDQEFEEQQIALKDKRV
jgi:hypothetical protein